MRSVLSMALLLVAGCGDPFATPGYSMAGTWTVLQTFVYEDNGGGSGVAFIKSCAGPTTATLKEDNSGNITGTIEGLVTCVNSDGTRAPNHNASAKMSGTQYDRDISLFGGAGAGNVCWSLTGTMTTPTTAEGTISAACGWTSAHGTWSATRK